MHSSDFIEEASFFVSAGVNEQYTHAIMNPPYKKLNTGSNHRKYLRKANIETVNLYTGFVALAISLLADKGELVAIIPRSFCNGTYYRPFRNHLFESCAIKHIHLFESRKNNFSDDDVLQENIRFVLGEDALCSANTRHKDPSRIPIKVGRGTRGRAKYKMFSIRPFHSLTSIIFHNPESIIAKPLTFYEYFIRRYSFHLLLMGNLET